MNTGTVRLLIADDHEMIRLGLRSILESDPRIRVVGEAASPQDAVYQAALLRPDVVLLDVRMPGGSGIDACREILGRNLGSKVIMLTSYADEDAVYESIMAGASGYLLKEINKAGLIDAVIAVSEGRSLLDPEVTRKVLERIRKMAASSDEVASGEQIAVVGAPLGLSDSVTTGVVSQPKVKLDEDKIDYIQFSAPINPGNSGGPVVNGDKQVVGIATAKIKQAEGLGFAIPIAVACQQFSVC